ncbi:MAG: S8 family serine peptidase, partial [Actinomycetota bacterium]
MHSHRGPASRRLAQLIVTLVVAGSFVSLSSASESAPAPSDRRVRVIVRELAAAGSRPERAVAALGGDVKRRLQIIDGFVADVPATQVGRLTSAPGVASVTRDRAVQLLGSGGGYDPKSYPASLYNMRRLIGALDMADRGYTGKGVDVALVDSGIVAVPGLDNSGKIVHGPDLSSEAEASNLEHLDTFGHGTHMAGIIAGEDGRPRSCLLILCSGTDYQDADDGDGVAPQSRIVSVKVADAHGATDVSQVIAAIDWVVQHRRDNGLNIRVLNLSFGTDGVQDYRIDPLAYAAEVAWHKGIVVVAAAGNSGFGTAKLNNPAYDPYLLAVGAADLKGTTDTRDDVIPSWSSRGNAARGPDLVAPGQSIA